MLGVIAGVVCVVGAAVYWWLERNAEKNYYLGTAGAIDRLSTKDLFSFPKSFWFIVGLCFAFYSAIFPFRTFAIKFFMHTHFADLPADLGRAEAGAFNSLLPMPRCSSPALRPSWTWSENARFMMIGSLLLMVFLIMMYTGATLWVPVIMMGTPLARAGIPAVGGVHRGPETGSAYALMTLIHRSASSSSTDGRPQRRVGGRC